VSAKRRKRKWLGESTVPADPLRAERPDHVCAFDVQFGVTVRWRCSTSSTSSLGKHWRWKPSRRIDADRVVDVLDRSVRQRGRHPEFVAVTAGRR
jgi:hypothetical protein